MDEAVFADAAQIPIDRAQAWVDYIVDAMDHYAIRTLMQQAAFIAQTCFETQSYQRWIENLNYSTARRLRNIFPFQIKTIEQAEQYVRQPEALANWVYDDANRGSKSKLGNDAPGDGWRYRGRGLIQLTGKNNYRAAQNGMHLPLLAEPELLEQKEYAAASAAWWWYDRHVNYWADKDDIDSVSALINCGDPTKVAHGQDERREAYMHALSVLEG